MRCPSCHHDNRSDRRFCTQCGTRLAMGCPSCGAPIEAGENFCGGCGADTSHAPHPASPAHHRHRPSRLQARQSLRARQAAHTRPRRHRLWLPLCRHPSARRGEHPRAHVSLHPALPPDPPIAIRERRAAHGRAHVGAHGRREHHGLQLGVQHHRRAPHRRGSPRAPARQRAARRRPDHVPIEAQPAEQLPARPPGPEDGELHRHRRHQHSGPRDPGEHGPHRRPQPRAFSAPRIARSSRRADCCWRR